MIHIPYNPATDPKQYLAQALQQGVSGYLAHRQKQQFMKGLSPTMAPMQLLQKALTAGYDPKTAISMVSALAQPDRLGKYPGWWADATPQQQQAYMNRVGGPVVQIGQKLLEPGKRLELAEEDYRKKTQPTRTDRTAFADTAFRILATLPKRGITGWGRYDYSREATNAGYEQYLNESGYANANENTRKTIRNAWYGLMKQIKGVGLNTRTFSVGKDEVDWDPKDAKVKELEASSGEKAAAKEQQAHRIIYDAWDQFPRKLQDAIRLKEQQGESYEDILQYDEIKEILQKVVK